jgi:hypothetical protein
MAMIFLSIAGNSYVKSTATVDYEFYKRIILIFLQIMQTWGQNFESVGWVSLPKYSGYAWIWFETVIGPIEIKYMVWKPKGIYCGLVLDFCFKFKYINKNSDICYNENKWNGLLDYLQFLIKRNPE